MLSTLPSEIPINFYVTYCMQYVTVETPTANSPKSLLSVMRNDSLLSFKDKIGASFIGLQLTC